MLLEAAAARLELLQRLRMLPGDLFELRQLFEGECPDVDRGAVPQGGPDADRDAVLQGPASRSLRKGAKPEQPIGESHRAESAESESQPSVPERVDHEDCVPLWWKDMKEETERKKQRALARSERRQRATAGSEAASSSTDPNGSAMSSLPTGSSRAAMSLMPTGSSRDTAAAAAATATPKRGEAATERTPRPPSAGSPSGRMRMQVRSPAIAP